MMSLGQKPCFWNPDSKCFLVIFPEDFVFLAATRTQSGLAVKYISYIGRILVNNIVCQNNRFCKTYN